MIVNWEQFFWGKRVKIEFSVYINFILCYIDHLLYISVIFYNRQKYWMTHKFRNKIYTLVSIYMFIRVSVLNIIFSLCKQSVDIWTFIMSTNLSLQLPKNSPDVCSCLRIISLYFYFQNVQHKLFPDLFMTLAFYRYIYLYYSYLFE